MPERVTLPGKYLEEVRRGPRSITGVPTSIAAFFGRTNKGPLNRAVCLQSYAAFKQLFGSPLNGSDLAVSVRLFFENGGTLCYVIRVAGTDTDSYIGNSLEHTGFYALDYTDLFNLMVIPGDKKLGDTINNLWAPASLYCQAHRAFLLIDPPFNWKDSPEEVTANTSGIRSLRKGVVTDHAAVFYPRIKVQFNRKMQFVGPAGAIAGMMARTDLVRGVWKSPAGIETTLIGVSGLEIPLTDSDIGDLSKEGVNCIRHFQNGIVNWSARTLVGADTFGSEWKYIPVRRLALYLEESLDRGTRWAVFEPNDEQLWAQIRLITGEFMNNLYLQGAFSGRTQNECYFVKCDRETTTPADIKNGFVNILIGFAPLKPAEFVVIRIRQKASRTETPEAKHGAIT